MNIIETKTFADKISDGLKSAVNEIEDLRIQGTLGLAEARDLFEQLKKKFHAQVSELKGIVDALRANGEVLKFINAIEFLEVQLALGKAESKEAFEHQSKRILVALRKLERAIKEEVNQNEQYAHLHFEIEKFKIKLDLLALHFQLKKITLQYNFEQRKYAFIEKLKNIKQRISNKENENKLAQFREEIIHAFEELKKAII
ncbi:MAG: hypothetical protein PSX36_05065 [bacterium]|nr:hypothetical protein [bacterium]